MVSSNFEFTEELRAGLDTGIGINTYQADDKAKAFVFKIFSLTNTLAKIPVIGTFVAVTKLAITAVVLVITSIALPIFAILKKELLRDLTTNFMGAAVSGMAFNLGEAIPGVGTLLHIVYKKK